MSIVIFFIMINCDHKSFTDLRDIVVFISCWNWVMMIILYVNVMGTQYVQQFILASLWKKSLIIKKERKLKIEIN